jgi:CheY-like chemotaxis protein
LPADRGRDRAGDPGGTCGNRNALVFGLKTVANSKPSTVLPCRGLAITPLYNSWAAPVHAKVGVPRVFIQSGHGCCVPGHFEIAVIDDDESFRAALVESLSSLGYGSSEYASAEDYVRVIGSKSFDCVVTDVHMPGMSGLDLMKYLAIRGSTIPVILITARSDSNLEAKAAAAGAACLLRKPFEINELIECIEGAVNN